MEMQQEPLSLIIDELCKMEQDPKTFIEGYQGKPGQTDFERIQRNLVVAWAKLLTADFQAAIQICTDNLNDTYEAPNLHLRAYYYLVKASALAMMMRFPEMKACLDDGQIVTRKCSDGYCSLAYNLIIANYLIGVQDVAKAETLMSKTASMMENITDPYSKADLSLRLGCLFASLSKYGVAMGYYVQCFQLSNRYNYRLKAISTCIGLISVNANLKNYDRAVRLYNYGLEQESLLDIPALRTCLHFEMGLQYKLRGNLIEAAIYYRKSLDALIESKQVNSRIEFKIYNNLANVLNDSDKHEEAYTYQLKALEIAKTTGNISSQMQLSCNIGLTIVGLKRYSEALPYFAEAEKYYRKARNWDLLIKVLRSEAFMYQESKDFKKAYNVMEKLDLVQGKLILQGKSDCMLYSGKKLDEMLNNTNKLKIKLNNAQKKLQSYVPDTFIGSSPASRKVVSNALMAAIYPNSGVFISGESGTGKEVIAQMIHNNSSRSDQPYITVNCASISPNLFESEFFGHVRGSFTGANQDKQGFFQLADKGSLFLDEISEMPIEFQAKLLRAIDTKHVIPVGKGKDIRIHCKIMASSNHNIQELIKANRFRLDLFHRISPIEIHIPPLRERPDDIPDLLDYFVQRFALETKKGVPQIAPDFIERLKKYAFNGNVRELKNFVERIFILFYKPVWDASILENFYNFSTVYISKNNEVIQDLKSIERQMIMDALYKCGGRQIDAAKLLHLTESTLSRKIKRYKITS